MAAHYYYFIAGLPDLFLDKKRNVPSFVEFMTEAEEAVTRNDRELLKAIRLPFDNVNVIAEMEASATAFDGRGNFSEDEITAAVKGNGDLPEYLTAFIAAFREARPLYPDVSWRDQLNRLFYETMCTHENRFLREWFTFELNVRNLLTFIALRKGFEHLTNASWTSVIGTNEPANMLRRSVGSEVDITTLFPQAEEVFALAERSAVDCEKSIDELRWRVLDELLPFDFFLAETILATSLKLIMVERWMRLDAEEGERKFERLIEDLSVTAGKMVNV